MFGKFALVFLLAFATAQGSLTGFGSIERYEEYAIKDIWEFFQKIVEGIKEIINNLGGDITNIFKQIKEKINEIIGGLNLKEAIEKIIQSIKDYFGEVGEVINNCIETQRPAIEKLAEESQAASMACVETAQKKIMAIEEEVEKLIESASTIKDEAINRGLKCIKDNILHPGNIAPCLQNEISIVVEQIRSLTAQSVELVKKAKDIATGAANELGNCMATVAEDANKKQEIIKDEIQKCISSH